MLYYRTVEPQSGHIPVAAIDQRVVIWFSCGEASAVAARLAVEKYPLASEVVYCDTLSSEHSDNGRFLREVSVWIDKSITVIESTKFKSVDEVFEKERYMSGIKGARCTVEMKKVPRNVYQRPNDIHIFGLTVDEESRIQRFCKANPELYMEWILRDHGIRKRDCRPILERAGIKLPEMYALGFDHNNCLGCVKATSPVYWARTRYYFPDTFRRRCEQSRELGVRLVRLKGQRIFLDELPEDFNFASRDGEDIECGPYCASPIELDPNTSS